MVRSGGGAQLIEGAGLATDLRDNRNLFFKRPVEDSTNP